MIAIVTGMIATYPLGGVVWDYGQTAVGLERLGFDVYYLEDTGRPMYDPRLQLYVDAGHAGAAYLAAALAALSPTLGRRWHLRAADGRCFGIAADDWARIVARADLLLNVSGGTLLRDPLMRCPRKVLVDTDPGWNHFRNYPRADADPSWGGGNGWRAHDFFFTYAEAIGSADCLLPTLGVRWQTTRPPVLIDRWQAAAPGRTWTTVLTWKNFAETIEHDGVLYGTKELEFARVETLPARVAAPLEIAVGGDYATSRRPGRPDWELRGWRVVAADAVAATADDYRGYIERSRGEFSVAKNVYVATRSGWFSCRTVCYLAAGRPAVVQDTGFAADIATGDGLIGFSTIDEAAAAIDRVESDYARHQAAARRVAVEHFDAARVLGLLLQQVGIDR